MPDQLDPKSVGCPTCSAKPGEPCTRDSKIDGEFHQAREVLAGRAPPGI